LIVRPAASYSSDWNTAASTNKNKHTRIVSTH
jgi:hypothetical protein